MMKFFNKLLLAGVLITSSINVMAQTVSVRAATLDDAEEQIAHLAVVHKQTYKIITATMKNGVYMSAILLPPAGN